MIVEIMGRPAPHIKEKLEEHISKLDKVKGAKTIKTTFSDTKKIENEDIYTCFCEIEFSCEDFKTLSEIVIGFMPASIEVVDPAQIKINCKDATEILSALTERLHQYDSVAKQVQGKISHLNSELTAAAKILESHGLIKDGKLTKEALKHIKKK